MRGRLLILIGIIILLVVIVVVVLLTQGGLGTTPTPIDGTPGDSISQAPTAGPSATPIPFVNIVVALQNLPRGYRFPDTIEELQNVAAYFPWPESAVPFNALQENQGGLETLLGQVARTDLFREQPILSTLIVEDLVSIANVGSDAAAVLPADRVGVSIPINRETGVAYGVQDGDRVDVVMSLLFVDVDEVFQSISPNNITLFVIQEGGGIEFIEPVQGRPEVVSLGPAIIGPSERQRPRLAVQRTIQDALVVHVGEFPPDGKFIGVPPTPTPVPSDDDGGGGGTPPPPPTPIPPPDIITLGVTPQNAVVLVWAIESKIPMTLLLRSASDSSQASTSPVTLDYVLSQFNIQVPGRRDYTLEPAIRSVRQLLDSAEISIGDGAVGSSAGG